MIKFTYINEERKDKVFRIHRKADPVFKYRVGKPQPGNKLFANGFGLPKVSK